MKEVNLNRIKKQRWIMFYEKKEIANKSFLNILPSYIKPIPINSACAKFLGATGPLRYVTTSTYRYVSAMYDRADFFKINADWGNQARDPLFACKKEWLLKKRSILKNYGIPPDMPYVCIHAREAGYSPGDEFKHSLRNIPIDIFEPALDFFSNKNIAVIRMGDASMMPLTSCGSYILDYCHLNERAPWLDLAIGAECMFFLTGASGVFTLASIFGRPVAGVCLALPFSFSPTGSNSDIGIPKLFRSKETGNLISFPKLYSSKISELRLAQEIDNCNHELITNSPDEVREVAEEMYNRIIGTWIDDPDDGVLQQRLRSLIPPDSYTYGTSSRCGALFLRRYRHLLG
jgi:putative glycosyltransferase (TIGR04372 family)